MNLSVSSRAPLPLRRKARPPHWPATLLLALLAFATPAPRAAAQSDPVLPPSSTLKKFSMEQLLDVVVTSVSKRPERLLDTASAIQVITADDVRRAGATSIPEALRLASNLQVAQIDSRQWAITSRGFNNLFADKLLVLIDGRSVYTPLYAGVYWDVQDTLLEDLDRIEVISGPGATQWGANAVNGVINITTKSARDTQGGLLLGGGGSELRSSGGARYGGQLAPGVYYRIYGKYTDRGDSVRPNDRASNDAWRTGQGGFRVDWDAAAGNTLTLQSDLYDATMGQPRPDNIRANGGNLIGRWSRQIGESSDFKLQVYYDRTHRRIPGSFTQNLDTYDVDFQYHLPVGSAQNIVWGLGYRRVEDDITNTPANAFLPPRVGREWLNAFAQDEIALSKDRLHLTLGTKIEHNDYTGTDLEPSARIAWTPDGSQTIWTAISRAVRTPSRIDRDLYSPATPPYRIAGGPRVVSEKLVAYELGYRIQADPQLTFSLATFYHDYDDLRSLEPLTPPLPFPVEISSGLRGYSVGAEFTADWRVTPFWRLHAGYTELRTRSEPQPGSIDRPRARSVGHDANQQAFLRSLFNLSAKWEFDTDLRYVGPINNQSVPGYTELNLRIGWHPAEAWEVSLEGRNLLHDHHAEFNTPGSRREIQRGVYGKISWRF
ncbi:MAG: TonB-dependent receptor [Undibacterium sp.]|nr:TonB-dependent receptor [Opitutaceae bacterium]